MSRIVYTGIKQRIPNAISKLKSSANEEYSLSKDDISELVDILVCTELLFENTLN